MKICQWQKVTTTNLKDHHHPWINKKSWKIRLTHHRSSYDKKTRTFSKNVYARCKQDRARRSNHSLPGTAKKIIIINSVGGNSRRVKHFRLWEKIWFKVKSLKSSNHKCYHCFSRCLTRSSLQRVVNLPKARLKMTQLSNKGKVISVRRWWQLVQMRLPNNKVRLPAKKSSLISCKVKIIRILSLSKIKTQRIRNRSNLKPKRCRSKLMNGFDKLIKATEYHNNHVWWTLQCFKAWNWCPKTLNRIRLWNVLNTKTTQLCHPIAKNKPSSCLRATQ